MGPKGRLNGPIEEAVGPSANTIRLSTGGVYSCSTPLPSPRLTSTLLSLINLVSLSPIPPISLVPSRPEEHNLLVPARHLTTIHHHLFGPWIYSFRINMNLAELAIACNTCIAHSTLSSSKFLSRSI